MRCGDWMSTNVECAWAGESVLTAAARMRFREIGFLPVCDDRGRVVGSVTDRDLALRVLADGRSARRTMVASVMTEDIACCRPFDSLDVAEQQMKEHKNWRIVCVDEEQRPLGVISLSDIVFAESTVRVGDVLRAMTPRPVRTH